jgi:outer membrane protein
MKLRYLFILLILLSGDEIFAQDKVSLEQVVALALEKNYDVRLAKNYVESVQTDDRYAVAALLPTINATGARTWTTADQKQIVPQRDGPDTLIIRDDVKSNNLNGSIQLSWVLFDGTRMFATRARVAELEKQGEILMKNQMVNTIAGIINSYYDIVRQKQQLKAVQEQMSVSEERVKLAQRKLEVGTGIKPELLQAQVDLNAQRAQVLQQETVIEQLKDQLNGLVGMQLPEIYDVSDSIVIDHTIAQATIASSIENSNLSLQASRKNVDIARLSLHERRGEYLPRLSFNSAYTFNKTENAIAVNTFTPLYNRNLSLNYGLSVTVPIFNGLNQRRLVQQAKINVFQQQLLYEQLKTNIDINVSNAFVAYDNARKILLIEEQTIGLAKENVFIALEGFKRGVTTFIELRTAQQSLADAYNRLISARYNTKVAETELLRLSGALLK